MSAVGGVATEEPLAGDGEGAVVGLTARDGTAAGPMLAVDGTGGGEAGMAVAGLTVGTDGAGMEGPPVAGGTGRVTFKCVQRVESKCSEWMKCSEHQSQGFDFIAASIGIPELIQHICP